MNNKNWYAGSDDEPADTDSLAREAFYGFRRDGDANYAYDWVDQYACNIETNNDENEEVEVSSSDKNKLSDEIEKLNKLLNDGILTQEEFEKAKKKILDQ